MNRARRPIRRIGRSYRAAGGSAIDQALTLVKRLDDGATSLSETLMDLSYTLQNLEIDPSLIQDVESLLGELNTAVYQIEKAVRAEGR